MLLFIHAPFFNSHNVLLCWTNLSLEFLHSRHHLLSVTLGYISSVTKLVEMMKDPFVVEARKFEGRDRIPGGPVGKPVCWDH